ncbi:hypothetical protein OEZ60_21625 [Defluviimonas sp. WL0024]|uniref:Uncharacterized protein n=1 Tax=Albidovulum salinarum TaxID=2984153 RepID=A0ABT2X9F0_9RHOB|nr:hypothetical protein [Defluviimonas sp. WL0024]MCU9850578.1 hypothetical protein [Defluviimonas sp. WL0024]
MNRLFSLELPFTRFLRNVVLVSLAALIPVVLLYVATRPGFGAMLLGGGPALSRFLRQIITNGLPVVFIVNYISFFLFAWMNTGSRGKRDSAFIVLVDITARLMAFVVLHALIYVLSADWFGSFAGSRITALSVVAPTLARSALFENISGAYLYATLVSALPLYVGAVERSALFDRLARRFPRKSGPVIIALALFACFALILSGIAALAVHLQEGFSWGGAG